jgi:amino-acid N-acetyltransferase
MREAMIRKALIADVKNIQQLINSFSGKGVVLPRSLSEIYDNLRDYSVYCDGTEETICGTCAIHVCWENLAEIRSLVVREDCGKRGVGKALVESCLAEAHELGIRRVFVLTYKKSFFEKLGFRTIDKSHLPHKIWADCLKCAKFPDCDEVAMEKEL